MGNSMFSFFCCIKSLLQTFQTSAIICKVEVISIRSASAYLQDGMFNYLSAFDKRSRFIVAGDQLMLNYQLTNTFQMRLSPIYI